MFDKAQNYGVATRFAICHLPQNLLALTGLEVHDVGHAVYVFLWFTLPPPPPCLHPLFYITVGCHTLQTISIQQCGFRVLPIFAICCLPHDLLALTGWEVHDVPVLLWFTLAPPLVYTHSSISWLPYFANVSVH